MSALCDVSMGSTRAKSGDKVSLRPVNIGAYITTCTILEGSVVLWAPKPYSIYSGPYIRLGILELLGFQAGSFSEVLPLGLSWV